MTITDEQVATLRAQLQGHGDEHSRLLNRLDKKASNQYASLVTAAFFEATRRRFMKDEEVADDAEVIEFVTSVRLRMADPELLDPQVGETLINIALGKLPPEARKGISGGASHGSKILLLAGLVADAQFNAEELDAFLATARGMADEVFS
ncbi:hypothetical protein BZB76_2490 [Actinomadura pelletieri DSM 43383]|uniref:Uncharacterized protein n=1 Tax=Actinomadura pelletieri DSM 43383 TaxID=1120940 RepID=A0A495QUC1_9ACTN|nr:hypothetical protein [Actinomadura pelletieri]RKS77116.1 hypothetical protein BZB76_2490 [Actinomadura pelletieri DSM 43383]